jgi:hypothetical protein
VRCLPFSGLRKWLGKEQLMSYRIPLLLVALALVLFVAAPVLADEGKGNTHTGTVVSVTGNKLVMKGTAENDAEHTHTILDTAIITCDGKKCELSDLKPGQKVRVTTKADDKTIVTKVQALDKNLDFPRGTGE